VKGKNNPSPGTDKREMLLSYIKEHPGRSLSAIRRVFPYPRGTISHHLKVLVREGKIRSETLGSTTRYYPCSGGFFKPPGNPDISDLELRIWQTIAAKPGSTQRELTEYLRMGRMSLSYHLKKMSRDGLIHTRRRGRYIHYFHMEPRLIAYKVELRELITDILLRRSLTADEFKQKKEGLRIKYGIDDDEIAS